MCIDTNILPQKLEEESKTLGYNFFEILNIDYLKEENFKKGTNLRKGLWTIYTHYKVNNKYYQLVFKPELNDNENINDFIVSFASNKKNNILRYIENLGVFVDTPKFYSNRRVEEKNNIFDTAGYVSLEIENIKSNTKEIIPIRILPSSIDYEDYIEMIEDLISIREDLVITDDGKVGIGKRWELKRNNYINCIDNIYNHLIQINNNPSSKLTVESKKVSYNKIKKGKA